MVSCTFLCLKWAVLGANRAGFGTDIGNLLAICWPFAGIDRWNK